MKILIIQLSDIHLKAQPTLASERLTMVPQALQNIEVDLQAAIVVVSGDIAQSGAAEEYAVAASDFAALIDSLRRKLRNVPIHFIAVPGNHDCNLRNPGSVRQMVIDTLAKEGGENVKDDALSICCSVQKEFFDFLNPLQTIERARPVANAYYEYVLPIGDQKVLFRCYNTAMASTNPERPSQLIYPVRFLGEYEPSTKFDYVVSVLHHPYNWLTPNNARRFRKHIEATSDLTLTGHEHEADDYDKYSRSGEAIRYLEGAAFHEHGAEDYSGFNAICVDLIAQRQKSIAFSWTGRLYEPSGPSPKWEPFKRSGLLSTRDFLLAEEMAKHLDDPGAFFTHPAKAQLTLPDICVLPDVRELALDDSKRLVAGNEVEGKDLLKFIGNKRRLLVIGRERSGKTTLAKVLFKDYYEKGFVPVMLTGSDITSIESEKFEALVQSKFQHHYQNPRLPEFSQLDRDQTVIIIDDFDHSALSAKGRIKLLTNIHRRFERLVVLNDDSIRFEEVAYGDLGSVVLADYAQLEIREYGHLLRSKLIERWCRLGSEYTSAEEEIERRISRIELLIDGFLGRSYLPSFPIFILSFLQALDAQQPVGASAGSYGYLYELLITRALATANKVATLDTKKTYLAELAYWMLEHGTKALSDEQYEIFHRQHQSKYSLIKQRTDLFRELEASGILTHFDGQYLFKYSYYYYYFVAHYIRDHLGEGPVRKQIERLCGSLHKEDYSNIWLFLTHLSKDPFLVDSIVAHARKLFTDIEPSKFQDDVDFFGALHAKIPDIVLVDRNPSELREQRRRSLDNSGHDAQGEVSDEDYETDEVLRLVAQLNAALRTMDVLGQIVKNFSGSLVSSTKLELVRECYMLGLRVIGTIHAAWRDDAEKIVGQIVDVILEREKDSIDKAQLTKDALREKVAGFIFVFCEWVSYGLIKRISQAVGSSELVPTYNEVLEALPSNAVALVDMSVKLDNLRMPDDEVVALNRRFSSSLLCRRLLKRLVVQHFYMFPTDYKTKQRLCEALQIPIKAVRGIGAVFDGQKRFGSSAS